LAEGYNKKKICLLYEEYILTADDKVFEKLMEEVEPIIDIVLTKYGKYGRHFDDVRQEMRLSLWKNFRNPERLKKFRDIPVTYLFFVVRAYMVRIFETSMRVYKDNKNSTSISRGERAVAMKVKSGFTTEKQCLLDALAENFILRIPKRIKRSNKFQKSLPEVQKMVMDKYKKKIDFDLERLIWKE